MTELTRIIKHYLICVIVTILTTLLICSIFIAKTNTGDVKVPETTSGGKCEIKTSTGDIKIRIPERKNN